MKKVVDGYLKTISLSLLDRRVLVEVTGPERNLDDVKQRKAREGGGEEEAGRGRERERGGGERERGKREREREREREMRLRREEGEE